MLCLGCRSLGMRIYSFSFNNQACLQTHLVVACSSRGVCQARFARSHLHMAGEVSAEMVNGSAKVQLARCSIHSYTAGMPEPWLSLVLPNAIVWYICHSLLCAVHCAGTIQPCSADEYLTILQCRSYLHIMSGVLYWHHADLDSNVAFAKGGALVLARIDTAESTVS